MKKSIILFSFAITVLISNTLTPVTFKSNVNAEAKSIDIFVKPKKVTNKMETSTISTKSSKNISSGKQVKAENNFSQEKIKWYSYAEGMKKAKETHKYVLIDFYTTWCGYCKKLDKETYTNEKVYKYINEKFIAIKVNAESDKKATATITERELSSNFMVNGYPFLVFLKGEDDIISRVPGYQDASNFYAYVTYIGSDAYKTQDLDDYKKANKV